MYLTNESNTGATRMERVYWLHSDAKIRDVIRLFTIKIIFSLYCAVER